MRKRIKYSQNFLKNADLIKDLLQKSSIGADDMVYEIGAGQGIITQELNKICKKVTVFEVDSNLSIKLKQRFERNCVVEIKNQDFLLSLLPDFEYKVFSNIPFNITADIIKKLTLTNNPPVDSYLIVQKEAAKKFLGKLMKGNNSLISVLIQVNFEMSLFHEFRKDDFIPIPMIDIVMIQVSKRKNPLVSKENLGMFYDFVIFGFSQFEPSISKGLSKIMAKEAMSEIAGKNNFLVSFKPSEVSVVGWAALFDSFMLNGNRNRVFGAYRKLVAEQKKLEKIHRTRVDKNWKFSKNH